jgi:hypothetical protein
MRHILAAAVLAALAGCTSLTNGTPAIEVIPGCTISGEWSAAIGMGGAASTSGRFDCTGATATAAAAAPTAIALPHMH